MPETGDVAFRKIAMDADEVFRKHYKDGRMGIREISLVNTFTPGSRRLISLLEPETIRKMRDVSTIREQQKLLRGWLDELAHKRIPEPLKSLKNEYWEEIIELMERQVDTLKLPSRDAAVKEVMSTYWNPLREAIELGNERAEKLGRNRIIQAHFNSMGPFLRGRVAEAIKEELITEHELKEILTESAIKKGDLHKDKRLLSMVAPLFPSHEREHDEQLVGRDLDEMRKQYAGMSPEQLEALLKRAKQEKKK